MRFVQIFLGGCIDLGDKGWDNYYGAGMVNARVLLSLPQRNVVQIVSPPVDAQLSNSIVPIIGSATTDNWIRFMFFMGLAIHQLHGMKSQDTEDAILSMIHLRYGI